jgi:hypothetical protein
MKRILYIFTIVLTAACTDLRNSNPYEESLNVLTVTARYPEGYEGFNLEGASAVVEDMNTGSRYSASTDAAGCFSLSLPDGIYRINVSGRFDRDVFNGAADKVVISGSDMDLNLQLSYSRAGSILIKELYCGGCKKLPQEGDYQGDQYFILHNNDYNVQYLDSLCFGTLSPNNATGTNPWVSKDDVTGETIFPDFLPVIQAVWQMPGDGDDFPLQPGEDAVICLRGAIDHTLQYPLSVDLNRPDYFVCYNITYFWNTMYHPAPGDLISQDRIVDVVIKTGQANAYTLSISSPTLVVWKPEGMTMHEFANAEGNVIPVPGSNVDDVVKIPIGWVYDAVEVFDARSTTNSKRLPPAIDAGYVMQTDIYLGRSLMRHVDETASSAAGYEVLADTNNSLNDFYETEKQSLHE